MGKNSTVPHTVYIDNNAEIMTCFSGGLIKHAAAITAITSPTVNCYRRIHTEWAADRKVTKQDTTGWVQHALTLNYNLNMILVGCALFLIFKQ